MYILCTIMLQNIPLFTLQLVCTWYEEGTLGAIVGEANSWPRELEWEKCLHGCKMQQREGAMWFQRGISSPRKCGSSRHFDNKLGFICEVVIGDIMLVAQFVIFFGYFKSCCCHCMALLNDMGPQITTVIYQKLSLNMNLLMPFFMHLIVMFPRAHKTRVVC